MGYGGRLTSPLVPLPMPIGADLRSHFDQLPQLKARLSIPDDGEVLGV